MRTERFVPALAVSILSLTIVPAAQGPPPTTIQIEKVKDNLYLLRGGGPLVRVGNVTLSASGTAVAFITRTGVVLVDSKLPGSGKAIMDALRTIFVSFVVNSSSWPSCRP